MRPARVSATKISPFGATRMMRGPLKPSANNSILKPGGTCGAAPPGLATTREKFAAEAEVLAVLESADSRKVIGFLSESFARRRYVEEIDQATRGVLGALS